MAEPKILLWDIETTHNLVAAFRLFEDFTPPENVLQERYVVCAAWKWLGEKHPHAVSTLDDPKLYKKDPHNDLHVLKTLHKVLSEADVIVAHNGDKYDIKFVEGRMLAQGLPALPPINSIDTLKVAKGRFLLNSNRLDYLGTLLKVGRKIKTSNSLWLDVLRGEKKAIKEMVKYNKQDVELLEAVFMKLRPYMPNYISRQLFGQTDGCPRCGSKHVQSRGFHKAITKVYRRYQCQDCSGWFRELMPHRKSTSFRIL